MQISASCGSKWSWRRTRTWSMVHRSKRTGDGKNRAFHLNGIGNCDFMFHTCLVFSRDRATTNVHVGAKRFLAKRGICWCFIMMYIVFIIFFLCSPFRSERLVRSSKSQKISDRKHRLVSILQQVIIRNYQQTSSEKLTKSCTEMATFCNIHTARRNIVFTESF